MNSDLVKYTFSTAPHSYFTVINLDESCANFLRELEEGRQNTLEDTSEKARKEEAKDKSEITPVFEYKKMFNLEKVREKLKVVSEEDFKRLKLVETAILLQDDDDYLEDFKRQNRELYRAPEKELFDKLIFYFLNRFTDEELSVFADYEPFVKLVEYQRKLPEQELFNKATYTKYKEYFAKYFADLEPSWNISEAFTKVYVKSNLIEKDWTLNAKDDYCHAHILPKKQKIIFSVNYKARKENDTIYNSIALHEIYGHAMRVANKQQLSPLLSEGWAVTLEQLNSPEIHTKRAYRFLAASLASGIYDGKALNFRETFEILWRIMALIKYHNHDEAKKYAFREVARIFRGGRPDLPGAIFLKDHIYFTGNLKIWHYLDKNDFNYTEFVELLEAQKEIKL